MLLAGVVGLVIWQRKQKAHYRALFQAEAARRQSEERHRITLMSVGDGVIATDAEGRIETLNPVAETLTGWASADARGRTLDEIFRIVNEETREPVESPVARVLREGRVVGLANHTCCSREKGTERPIADSGAPIRDEDGEPHRRGPGLPRPDRRARGAESAGRVRSPLPSALRSGQGRHSDS